MKASVKSLGLLFVLLRFPPLLLWLPLVCYLPKHLVEREGERFVYLPFAAHRSSREFLIRKPIRCGYPAHHVLE